MKKISKNLYYQIAEKYLRPINFQLILKKCSIIIFAPFIRGLCLIPWFVGLESWELSNWSRFVMFLDQSETRIFPHDT